MLNQIKNILIINSGGGFGDTVQYIPLLDWFYNNYPNVKIYYYANDYEKFYFENNLKNFKKNNTKIIKNFPKYFGFRLNHYFKAKNLAKINSLNSFDLIIDNQSKIRNLLIYKNIPHKYFFSPSLNYFFCKPSYSAIKRTKNVILRIVKFLEKITNDNVKLNYNIKIDDKFINKANKLIDNKQKFFGISLTAGHKTRKKQFNQNEILETIKYFSKNYKPVFFIEEKNSDIVNFIKNNVPYAIFPEHGVEKEFQSPELLIALANKMEFNLSIDNGVAHLLSLSNSKTFCFYPGNAEKFKPLKDNFFAYNCDNYEGMEKITSQTIIKFVEINL